MGGLDRGVCYGWSLRGGGSPKWWWLERRVDRGGDSSKRFNLDVEMMLGRRAPTVLSFMLSYITPVIMFAALNLSLFMYDPPSYGTYIYPVHAKVIGILMAVLMTAPIPITLIYQVAQRKGTIMESCERHPKTSMNPAKQYFAQIFR
ncbi:sodium-dependent proline transporter-like [Haliotis rubra]|uniref:sodium-dependent proline transporter-like n=1 Tax=Haliotis rubra TaxID=36100 RepID=UPI001EE60164|nr:sodium-dependent proline transporter-like [Haliotis rubra]